MMRLSKPQYSLQQTLDECIAGIAGNAVLLQKMESNRAGLVGGGERYLVAASTGELHTVEPIQIMKNVDPFVINDLKKSELIKLYDQYLVPEEKPARKIYEALLNAAKEKCPFCGGIGTPRNLDHFLPKAHFPQFAVLPLNLIPACRDCNMDGKAHSFAIKPEDQIIQPYVDNDRFFLEQWVFSTYHGNADGEPGDFEYFVCSPEEWCEVDKQRVKKHFVDFDLAKRYATKAAEQLGTILQQIYCLQKIGLDNETINGVILQPGVDKAPFVNHWQTGMYQALMRAVRHPVEHGMQDLAM